MNNYYTSLQDHNGKYTGLVHNIADNSIIYQTKFYPTQEQVNLEITEFLKTNNPPNTNNLPQIETAFINSLRTASNSCCGRS